MIRTDGLWIKEGQFLNGRQHGYGRYMYHNQMYIGKFKNEAFNGFGILIDYFGTYVGTWQDGFRHGYGR